MLCPQNSNRIVAIDSVTSLHIIISYQKIIVRPLLRERGPWVHNKSQPNAKTPSQKKSTDVKSLTKIV